MINYVEELRKVKHKQRVFVVLNGFESTTFKVLIEHYKEKIE